ncbi:MAG: alpha-amylase family glycosyl hydrolase [Thermoflexales bacterium]
MKVLHAILSCAALVLLPVSCAAPQPSTTFAPPGVETRPAETPPQPIVTPPATTPTAIPSPTADRRPTIETPAWLNDAVIYQVFIRSFYDANGDGIGDINGLRQKLDYIQSLGADTIWINPHYPSPSYHGYDVSDYFAVNPQFGTMDDFKALVSDLHQRGMRLIVDYVANHTSREHPFFKDAYGNPQSDYTKWFSFRDRNNLSYESFFGQGYMPEWNHAHRPASDYLIEAALFWLDLGADGLRCDYARGVEDWFWERLRKAIKARHPQAVILGEVWDSNTAILQRYFNAGFDALFDFPWYLHMVNNENSIGRGVINGQTDPIILQVSLGAMQRLYPRGAQVVRFGSNHDTNRIASAVENDPRRMRLMAAATILLPGTPIIYYGEEIGMRGVKGNGPIYDELRREPMDWYAAESGPGMTTWFKPAGRNNQPHDGVSVEEQEPATDSLLNFYRALVMLRRQHLALRSQTFQIMREVEQCATCFGIWRWDEQNAFALFLNFSDQPQTARIAERPTSLALDGTPNALFGVWENEAALLPPWGFALMQWRRTP